MSSASFVVEVGGARLDRFLREKLPERSRAFLQKLIESGHVRANGKLARASYRVHAGDKVIVEIPPPRPLETRPEPIPLHILYEDGDLIVINKPAGMVVHPAAGNFEHTLVNALLHHCGGQLAGIGGAQRPGIVHRLDKGTSGCIVVAKTNLAHQNLAAQFKSRAVKKIYRALCWGRFERAAGTVETTIGRSERNRKKMAAMTRSGRQAHTDFRVLRQGSDFALLELTIHTGRTHQIRVHMAHIGHPVLGDAVYGQARRTDISVERPMLHAYKLGFAHPRTHTLMEFIAPIPQDMEKLVGRL